MKETLLPTLLVAALVGGGVAYLTGQMTGSSPRAGRGAVSAGPGVSGSSDDGLAATIDQLRREKDELELRIAALEGRPVGASGVDSSRMPLSEDDGATLAKEDRSMQTLLQAFRAEGPLPELFVARVGQALEAIEAEEERLQEIENDAAQAERIEERLADLRADLGLSQFQVDETRKVLLSTEEKREELFSGMREGTGDRGAMRDGMREIRDTSETAMAAILDPDQFQRYQESQGGGFGGFRGGGGGGDRGGGDRGGGDRGGRGN